MKRIFLAIVGVLAVITGLWGQAASTRDNLKRDTALVEGHPYIFPILGDKVAERGFKLPLPHGIMPNVLYARQDIEISGLQVGFNDSPLINLDSLIRFDQVQVEGYTANVRLDTWVLPFLAVHGIFGYTDVTTTVKIGEPVELETSPKTGGQYLGVGAVAAGGIGKMFFSWDFTHIWSYSDKLDKPAKVFTSGFRTGPIFRFKNNPEMNIVPWVGIMYSNLSSQTVGRINAADVFPDGPQKIEDLQMDLENWFDGLGPIQMELLREKYEQLQEGLESVKEGFETGSITYEMQKGFEDPWNLIIGGQWQINDTWQIRGEAQLLGSRVSGMISANYRFGIKGKTLFSASDD